MDIYIGRRAYMETYAFDAYFNKTITHYADLHKNDNDDNNNNNTMIIYAGDAFNRFFVPVNV